MPGTRSQGFNGADGDSIDCYIGLSSESSNVYVVDQYDLDGKEFDSSYTTGKPAEFPLSGVIKCWTEGVQLMKVGGKAKLTCPAPIAYGTRGAGVIGPNETLVFRVELVAVVQP